MGHASYVDTMIDSEFACFAHPQLGPDAWHQVDSGKPVDLGAQAALVCRFSCRARARCPVTRGDETICGQGWFDRTKHLRPFHDNEIEEHQAAAYLGMSVPAFLALARYRKMRVIRKEKHLRFYDLERVKLAAQVAGPSCGSVGKLALHEIRGDGPCLRCQSSQA